MRPEQWDIFKRAARREKLDKVPMALIVDSPWIPGYLGIKHMDYYLDPQLWFESNLKIMREFPDIIMVPSWWMEYGMAAEPSVLGRKDQVLAGQHAERVPHALSPRGHRPVSRVRGRSRRVRGDDAAPDRHAQAADPRSRLHPSHDYLAWAVVHCRLRAKHDEPDDRVGRKPGGVSQAD